MAENCSSIENSTNNVKKRKLDEENPSDNSNLTNDENTDVVNFAAFQVKRILQNNNTKKQIFIEGTFEGVDDPAIVLLERKPFPAEEVSLKTEFFNSGTTLRKLLKNDIYANYECFPNTESNGLNTTIIYPATTKHIEKFLKKELHIIDETQELYEKVTLPFIESNSFSLQWVDNILEHKAEQENIVYEDPDRETGFILISDLKWDGQPSTLKLLALPFLRLKSIRELNASHLPLLKNIQDAGCRAISKKFNIPKSQLRIYFHYQPSYYHLHVHFGYLMAEAPGIFTERAHLLTTVIRNIELIPNFYEKATIPFVLAEGDPLFNKFQEFDIVQAAQKSA